MHMKSFWARTILCVCALSCSLNATEIAANAVEPLHAAEYANTRNSDPLSEADKRNITGTLKAVQQDSESRNFDYELAIASGVDPGFAKEFAVNFAAFGGAVTNLDWDAPEAGAMHPMPFAIEPRSAVACLGKNHSEQAWWGFRTYLNSCNATSLSAASSGAATVTGVTAALASFGVITIPASGVLLIVGGIIGMGGLAIYFCNREGEGITLNAVITPLVLPPTCTTQ